jgi:hypothetical protein
MWLHMGTFGPKRIVVPDTQHQEGAPYTIVNNEYSCWTSAMWSSSTRPAPA